jgi:hypothetical protein
MAQPGFALETKQRYRFSALFAPNFNAVTMKVTINPKNFHFKLKRQQFFGGCYASFSSGARISACSSRSQSVVTNPGLRAATRSSFFITFRVKGIVQIAQKSAHARFGHNEKTAHDNQRVNWGLETGEEWLRHKKNQGPKMSLESLI